MKNNNKNSTKISLLATWLYNKVHISAAIWISLFIFGLLSYTVLMQRQGFPSVNVPISTVSGLYLTGNKAVLDEQLTKPLVEIIQESDKVISTTATSTDNQTTIIVEYQEDVTAEQGSKLIQDRINSNQSKIPNQAQLFYTAIEATKFNNKYDILLSLSGENLDTKLLNNNANSIVADLKKVLSDAKTIEVEPLIKNGIDPVTKQETQRQTEYDWYGGTTGSNLIINPSIIIGLTAKENVDIVNFDKQISKAIEGINKNYENKNLKLNIAASFAPNINQQINALQKNLLEGLIIVIIVSLIFIGVKAGALAALGMFVTLTTTIGILYASGITLNTISLFGLVLCLGLIVDDTIIMIEALDRQKRNKRSQIEAIKVASRKVALASAAGTFTTILGFAPLLFISGILGEFIRILPITIIVSLAVSLLVSLFFIPFMSRWFINPNNKIKNKYLSFDILRKGVDLFSKLLASFIIKANNKSKKIRYVFTTILISFIFIASTGPVFSKLKFDIFPTAKDSDELVIEYSFMPGISLVQAQEITNQANKIISDNSDNNIKSITYLGTASEIRAQANINLISYEKRDKTASEIANEIKNNLSQLKDVRIAVNQQSAGPPKEEFPFKVQIDATDPNKADLLANNLVNFLKNKEINRPNDTKAKISEVSYSGEKSSITRKDQKRIVQVLAAYDAKDTSALVQATQKLVEDKFLNNKNNLAGLDKSAVTFDFGSESENQESFKSVLIALPILALLMYLLLAIQFRSILQPILILIAVPFSFLGVAVALLITNNPLSFFVMIAFFALIGISVNNTILLTDFANQSRKQGKSPRQAMADAITERTRPLLTTSFTSILALLPLALTDPFWESLAVTLIGGLTASAILVLVSYPSYYLCLEAVRSRYSQFRIRSK